jgi:hypothetical protein
MSWTSTVRSLRGNKVSPVGMAIRELHRSENDLALALLRLSDTNRTDHEVYYVARDIARWSQEHVRDLARVGRHHGVELAPEPAEVSAVMTGVRHLGAQALGRRSEPGLLLLAGLRRVHRMAAGVSLDWEILAQTAQAIHDSELLGLAQDAHPQTLRQLRWANAKLKESSPQVMAGR